ncbi:MAG TPA: hypothetical protein VHC90_05310, partial [Bryobacteraceae bacterium]|nr:hypothetical protein [Bryobacteraceae bacterium]
MTASFQPSGELSRNLGRWTRMSFAAGILLIVASVTGAFFSPGDFFRSYLAGFLLCVGVALGCLGVLMLQYLTGGAWGVVSRRTLEAGTRTLPFLALLFVPILFGLRSLYDWANPALV